jgi:hypothetical protein
MKQLVNKFVEIDERVTISAQMDEDENDPVIVMNKFNVNMST